MSKTLTTDQTIEKLLTCFDFYLKKVMLTFGGSKRKSFKLKLSQNLFIHLSFSFSPITSAKSLPPVEANSKSNTSTKSLQICDMTLLQTYGVMAPHTFERNERNNARWD